MLYECIKKTAIPGKDGKLYLAGETEDFDKDPGKHWKAVGKVIAAPEIPKVGPEPPKAKPGPKPKD